LFFNSDINEISQYNLNTKECVRKYKGTHYDIVKSMGVSHSGKRLFSGGKDGRFCFYNVPDEEDAEQPQVIDCYGSLPKIQTSYGPSICLHR
jgi:WD40 repeat protein